MGLHSHCRSCQKICKRQWYLNNRESELLKNKDPEYKQKARKRRLERYWKDEIYRARELEKNRIRRRGEVAKIKQRRNEKLRRKINPSYRLRIVLNSRLRNIFKNILSIKTHSIIKLIDCSLLDLVRYIESQWKDGMSWANYGRTGWHIDHIVPCCAFDLTNPEEQKRCYHYTNLQPLWWYENLSKGAKLENGQDARVFHQTRNYRKDI